ncbi:MULTISPECIES: tripartite tricarboxylate transporter TctB family protein [unclassified Paracoccus (in: a-proteobacteria)]|uniref:tripartite tricarboxylate transporter TctB family protein n=1 Tax=unclassified Paracoccus (in: a-proteobacteria) TaxID=2688777 RepID=UPI0015FF0F6E|nr:tripartite tricarboxylate transporter TctB family protein [Paracoccus sp. MC1862]MBB1491971.1 tripartite tricarboxylate transporter TctB family protein [Paracoccus sp. MC1854]MBB1498166.1 tripartite tricarboxylate transporter TctB family protein [Paracoccus sp. MC1862]QQO45664.1 tripartite tricarboxylate transporter TctB family protein [Paracoccus sp. MC1862]
MSTKPKDNTDLIAGLGLMAVAAFFGWQTLGLEIGTSLRMGPGYFPMILSGLMFLLGLVIFLQAFGREGEPMGPIAWRGIFFILPAPIFFGLTVRGLGFVPALFITTLIASQASVKMRPGYALLLAVLVTVISTLIFSYGLGLPFRRFGPWVQF